MSGQNGISWTRTSVVLCNYRSNYICKLIHTTGNSGMLCCPRGIPVQQKFAALPSRHLEGHL